MPPWPRPVLRCPWPPASRRLGAPKLLLRSPLRLPGARRFEAWLHAPPESPPPREPEPFSPCSARRFRSEDSVIQFRLACAPRYVAYIRGPITPGQGVFSNPQGYPRKFPSIPRNTGVVHRSCTGKSPDLRPTGSDFVDGTAAFGLNGADGTTPGHGRDHYVEHVSPRARQAARGRLFCCPRTGTDR